MGKLEGDKLDLKITNLHLSQRGTFNFKFSNRKHIFQAKYKKHSIVTFQKSRPEKNFLSHRFVENFQSCPKISIVIKKVLRGGIL